MTLDEFIEKVCNRPLPTNPMARIRTLARELAEGASEKLWEVSILTRTRQDIGRNKTIRTPMVPDIRKYLDKRWGDVDDFLADLLIANRYLEQGGNNNQFRITEKAFALLDEVEPATIFISYKRSESSAFALLVSTKLRQADLEPFVDMSIEPGDDWHAELKERIQASDYFVLLLGPETLTSDITCKEIGWALEAGANIIPVWHNGFEYKSAEWPELPEAIDVVVSGKHRIAVHEESASGYNTAIVELLNRFGITP
jgi:hypothetical protein